MNTTATALLFFSGIIAFVQDVDEPFKVNALLLKVPEHRQKLALPLKFLVDPDDCRQPCEDKGTFCECTLEDAIVSLPSLSGSKSLPHKPPGSLPDQTNYGDIDWLVSMWYVKADAARLLDGKVTGTRIKFGWNDGATCRFEESSCKGKRRIWGIKFNTGLIKDAVQAVAEEVVFQSEIVGPITIEKGQETAVLRLNCTSGEECPIFISNSMKSSGDAEKLCTACDALGGSHFSAYTNIVNGYLAVIPERLCGKYYTMDEVLPALCVLPKGDDRRTVGDRIICPSTIFQP